MVPRVSAIERAERLVEQQHLGWMAKSARDTDALLHAAGELRGFLCSAPVSPTMSMNFWAVRLDLDGVPLRPFALHGEGDVFHRRQPRHQRMALEHHAALDDGPATSRLSISTTPSLAVIEAGEHVAGCHQADLRLAGAPSSNR